MERSPPLWNRNGLFSVNHGGKAPENRDFAAFHA
jgi:hypothetical protein